MARTVVIVDENGRLISARGISKETSALHYRKFAKRLLGTSGNEATLDFGWDGKGRLVVSKAGGTGERIELLATVVAVPEKLEIGGKDLQEYIDDSLGLAISDSGFKGSAHYVKVSTRPVDSADQPKQVCTVELEPEFIARIEQMEKDIHSTLPTGISFGDGLSVEVVTDEGDSDSESSGEVPSRSILKVKIGSGIKWEGELVGNRALAVDAADSVSEEDRRPVTSAGVFAAISGGLGSKFRIAEDEETGNFQIVTDDD